MTYNVAFCDYQLIAADQMQEATEEIYTGDADFDAELDAILALLEEAKVLLNAAKAKYDEGDQAAGDAKVKEALAKLEEAARRLKNLN
jgi:hypothetical protein